jgi:cation diffusion facilitator CzcD-associated flavoprotein CzcO
MARPHNSGSEHIPVVIVGAGFAGVALAVKLREAGITDFVVLEKADTVGGVWRDNTYPGCACDVPSSLYSYSFAPNPNWTRMYAPQPEILAYIESVANDHGVTDHLRPQTELLEAHWDEDHKIWCLATSRGPLTASVLVSAMGPLGEPVIPDIPGIDSFAGPAFHSARWDHDCDLAGKRVAVIGTGASAVQIIPALAPDVAELVLFQRTPPWVLPRLADHATSRVQRTVYRLLPQTQRAVRMASFAYLETLALVNFVDPAFRYLPETAAKALLRLQVENPALRAQLTPEYMFGCKRPVTSDTYLPALDRDNVHIVTDAIAEITADAVVTRDGVRHPVDAIIWGTGFDAPSRQPDVIRGRDGHSPVELNDKRPQSYLGTALAGFPNLFWLLGPYGTAGNQSALFMIECQVRYVVDAIRTMRTRDIATVEVRADVQEQFLGDVEARSQQTVWVNGGCRSYYQTPDGRNAGLWPNWTLLFARVTRRFDPDNYELRSAQPNKER